MKKPARKRLSLSPQTLRPLAADDLGSVAGGLLTAFGCGSVTSYGNNKCVPSIDIATLR